MKPRHPPAALSQVFFALGDPTRQGVVELLACAPRRASDLASELGASRPGMSRHLRILREAGVVREESDEADGRAHRVALEPAAFAPVRDFLDRVEDFWSAQLCSLKTHAEARARALAASPKRKRREAS